MVTRDSGRVRVDKLDLLIDTIGELAITKDQILGKLGETARLDAELDESLDRLDKMTRQLQSLAMGLRMFPLRDLFNRTARHARDHARRERCDIRITMTGEETELDKKVIEAITDPLVHLVQNAVDHGAEPVANRARKGKPSALTLQLDASYRQGQVVIRIQDDGRGLDRGAMQDRAGQLDRGEWLASGGRLNDIIFEPGFTTAQELTRTSGRGVGMDVVRRNVEQIGGAVTVESEPGLFTSIELVLPLTLAVLDGFLVQVGVERFVIPLHPIEETLRPEPEQVQFLPGDREMIAIRSVPIPVFRLARALGIPGDCRDPSGGIVIVLKGAFLRYGLLVDHLLGRQQFVIKSLGPLLEGLAGYSGATLIEDGAVCLIINPDDIPRMQQDKTQGGSRNRIGTPTGERSSFTQGNAWSVTIQDGSHER